MKQDEDGDGEGSQDGRTNDPEIDERDVETEGVRPAEQLSRN